MSSTENKLQQFLGTTKALFPFNVLLLALLPTIVGVFVDYDLVNLREIILNLIWLPFFTLPFLIWKRKILYQVVIVFYSIIGCLQIMHWLVIKGPITITSLMVIANTNFNEAVEFSDLKFTYWLLLLIPYLAFCLYSVMRTPRANQLKHKWAFVVVILSLSTVFILENAINGRLIRKGVPQFAKISFSFFKETTMFMETMKDKQARNVDAVAEVDGPMVFMLIIGESCNRNHMSLYGYHLSTSPLLEKRDDIVVFTDVVTAYSNTIHAVLSIFSQAEIKPKKSLENNIDLIDVFHSAGFKTYWISNQNPIGVWDNLVTVFSKKTDINVYANLTNNSSFESMENASYDIKLLPPLISALKDDAEKKFIIVHLMGSHSIYRKRYPSEFDVFGGEGDKAETIAQYDNSILYNDFIVDSLFSVLAEYKKNNPGTYTSAIYLSDHGENVYDENNKIGHDFAKELPSANVEIPFIVCFPIDLSKENLEMRMQMGKNKGLPYVSDNTFHSVLDLNHISSPLFDKTKSIFNNGYNASRKRILEDGRDYDTKD